MKKGDLRRGQILDAAERLFFQQGYDRTSIQDILNALNLSKGGFYHYFDAKESVLQEICERRWTRQFDRLRMELYTSRKSPIDKLDTLLRQASLFETEDAPFAALILKLCFQDRDASLREHRRRVLVERLSPYAGDVLTEGVSRELLHTRRPMETGRLLVLLACDVNDEVCDMLAADTDNPDRMLRIIELLNAYRESVETLSGAPFGTIVLFEAGQLLASWRKAVEALKQLEEKS